MLRIQQPTPNQKCIASMASDGGNKAKREGMYVYNIVADVPPTSVKNVISKGWGTLMRSKTYRESSGTEKMVAEWGGEVVESRKSGRRSVSEVEANVGSVAAFLQVKVLVSDMPGFMQVHAFRCATTTYDSLDKFSSKRMAHNMKKEFMDRPGIALWAQVSAHLLPTPLAAFSTSQWKRHTFCYSRPKFKEH